MYKTEVSAYSKCPYFKKENRMSIVCEDIDGESIRHEFTDKSEKIAFARHYCYVYPHTECPLAIEYDKKWES